MKFKPKIEFFISFLRVFVLYPILGLLTRRGFISRIYSNNLEGLLKREMIDVYNFSHINESNYTDFVQFDGIENLESFNDSPVIFYTCHYGRFVLPLICLGKVLRPMGCIINDASGVPYIERVFRTIKLSLMEKYMRGAFYYTNHYMHSIFKFLKKNGMLVYLIDIEARTLNKSSLKVNFLDRDMLIFNSIIRLASKTNATLIPFVAFESLGQMYPVNCKILEKIQFNSYDSKEEKMRKILKPLEIMKEKKEQWWIN